MGEPLYLKVEPDGYSFRDADWVSSSELLERMNFAVALARNRIPGVKVTGEVDPMTIGSPDFQKH
jgi:hypothetical protein